MLSHFRFKQEGGPRLYQTSRCPGIAPTTHIAYCCISRQSHEDSSLFLHGYPWLCREEHFRSRYIFPLESHQSRIFRISEESRKSKEPISTPMACSVPNRARMNIQDATSKSSKNNVVGAVGMQRSPPLSSQVSLDRSQKDKKNPKPEWYTRSRT